VPWAAIEAVQRIPSGSGFTSTRIGITERRGRNIATVAVARKLLAHHRAGAGAGLSRK